MPALERIGRFRVTGELGRGAMGTVYRAVDDSLDREVALKVMSHGLVDAEARARFQREARAAARLAHPNIVVIYELGEHEGAPFMALELLEGVDLAHAIARGIRPDPRTTLPLVLQMLAGLGHAHEHGIVHRDVKPSNVFLPYGRPAKIMDFGVARLAGGGTTTSGSIVGTPNYMSPEQVGAGEIDGRSDLFSAGLILYELVTGEKAVRADTVVAALYKILHEAPDLSVLPSGRGWSDLHAVLARALARRREDRYPSATAMAEDVAGALVAFGGNVDLSAATDQLLVLPRQRPRPSGGRASAPPAPARRPSAASGPARAAAQTPSVLARPRRQLRPAAWIGGGAALALAAASLGVGLLLRGPAGTPPASPRATASTTTAAAPLTRGLVPTAKPADQPGPPRSAPPPAEPLRPTPAPASTASPVTSDAATRSPELLLLEAREHFARGRWKEALQDARTLLDAAPSNREASQIAQEAEVELVVEDCLEKARAAVRAGDRDRAIEEVRRGFMVRKNDPRLLAMHAEALQQ